MLERTLGQSVDATVNEAVDAVVARAPAAPGWKGLPEELCFAAGELSERAARLDAATAPLLRPPSALVTARDAEDVLDEDGDDSPPASTSARMTAIPQPRTGRGAPVGAPGDDVFDAPA